VNEIGSAHGFSYGYEEVSGRPIERSEGFQEQFVVIRGNPDGSLLVIVLELLHV